jgi:lipopolysaccharide heptosyltransferase II
MGRVSGDPYRIPKRLVKSLYSLVVRSIYPPPAPAARGADADRSILVVRADGLGDLLLSTPMLKVLRETYPQHRISLLTRKEWVGIVQNNPYIDEIIPWEIEKYSTNLFYRLRFLRELRTRKFGLLLHPVYSREPKIDEVVCCCRAAEKIGFDGDLNNISLEEKTRNNASYTRLARNGVKGVLEIDRNRAFTEEVIGIPIESTDFRPLISLGEADRAAGRKLLEDAGLHPNRDLIGAIFPGAAWKGREWPAQHYSEIADRIVAKYGAKIVILGSGADVPVASSVASSMNAPHANLTGKTRLRELAAILELCSFFIGNETGPLHMAAALDIPTLGIIGGGHFGRFYPYGDLNRHRMVYRDMDCFHCDWKCVHDSVRCIQEITADTVWQGARRLIEEVVLPGLKIPTTNISSGVQLSQ